MRKINLKQIEFNDPEIEPGSKLNYVAQLMTILKFAPEGMRHSEMIDILPIYSKLKFAAEQKKTFILIEESDFSLLVSRIQRFPFPMFSETFATFCSDVINSEQVETKLATKD